MVDLHGGCDRCGRLSNNSLESYERHGSNLYCSVCEDKYYSVSSIRDNKIDFILKDNWKWHQRIIRYWIFQF